MQLMPRFSDFALPSRFETQGTRDDDPSGPLECKAHFL